MCVLGVELCGVSFAQCVLTNNITISLPVYDKTVLVIPKPGQRSNLTYQTQKVLEPFTPGLWAVVIAIILAAALLSVWFSDRKMAAKKRYGMQLKLDQSRRPPKRRKFAYFRLILDAILEKGMFFFSAGIEQDTGASLPHKVLMFGFGFFILIAVSAYVANLAAFLTQSGLVETEFRTMKQVIDKNARICGHPALEGDLRLIWPKANWIFPTDGPDGIFGMFEAYDRGDCKVLAIGRESAFEHVESICEHGLVFTDVLIHEIPIAFPIRPQLASAFSYWVYTAEKSYGYSFESAKQAYIKETEIKKQCEIELSNLNQEEADDFAPVSESNMFLPIMAFAICAFIAVVLQLIHENKKKNGRRSAFGRHSTLGISWVRGIHAAIASDVERGDVQRKGWDKKVDEDDSEMSRSVDEDDSEMPRSKSMVRRSVNHDKSDAGDDAGGDAKREQMCDFPGANIPGDEFYENGAPQSQSQSTLFRD